MREIRFRVSVGAKTIGYEMLKDGLWVRSDDGVKWATGCLVYHQAWYETTEEKGYNQAIDQMKANLRGKS